MPPSLPPPLPTISIATLRDHGHGHAVKYTSIHDVVYDVSEFLDKHPGGKHLIEALVGKDGTSLYSSFHPKSLVSAVLGGKVVGVLNKEGFEPSRDVAVAPSSSSETKDNHKPVSGGKFEPPPLDQMINTFDFEAVAKRVLTDEAWGYYSSGADDEISLRENHAAFQRVWLRPRILVNVKHVDVTMSYLFHLRPGSGAAPSITIPSSLPIYLSATAMGKLANPEGEVAIVKAAHRAGVVYMLPTLSSCDLDEMLAARDPQQPLFSQLYVNSDRSKTEEYVARVRATNCGVKALFVTVDAPQLGRREKDMRNKFVSQKSSVQYRDQVQRNLGVTRAISSFIDPSLSWADLKWLREIAGPDLALFLKGVQCVEDAVLAYRSGLVNGIVLSNHGGRQLDASASGIELLAEVMPALRKEKQYHPEKFHVYIDGGVRRGADVFKAIALGATAVGIGRPVLYALSGYGQDGIIRLLENFKDELEMVMRLMGTPKLSDLTPACVVTRDLSNHPSPSPRDFLQETTYEPLRTQVDKMEGASRL